MLTALSHYRRSKSAQAIGAELAWINWRPKPEELRAFREFELYWQGAYEEAKHCGFRLEEFTLKECGSVARLEKILRARNIRGILIPPHGSLWTASWQDFDWREYCIVRLGHSIAYPRAHLVTSDQITDGMIAFENIWKHGYRRIGYVTTHDTMTSGTRFYAGFVLGQIKMGDAADLPPLLLGDAANPKEDQKLVAAWLQKNRPDAIFTDRSYMRDLLTKCGRRVPADIGLAATSVLDGKASAGIDQNPQEIGKAAIQLLISLINHNEHGIPKVCREVVIEGGWVDGDTMPAKV
jgi:DNA-binding LacI/PurR family transcriptional regulator